MESQSNKPFEVRAAQTQELLEGRHVEYGTDADIIESKVRMTTRERVRRIMRLRRRFESVQQLRRLRQVRIENRMRAVQAARRFMDYAISIAPRGSRREERREKLRDRLDQMAR